MPVDPTPPTAAAAESQTNYKAPGLVLSDPNLSPPEKLKALDTLEQDSRGLAVAANEGRDGGEPTALTEVLLAEAALKRRRPKSGGTV